MKGDNSKEKIFTMRLTRTQMKALHDVIDIGSASCKISDNKKMILDEVDSRLYQHLRKGK
jgi:hypothetical protein